tara:strand:+ start:174 stop:377 length:204 start_codon:yes stop_codon:yes gene_type:complete
MEVSNGQYLIIVKKDTDYPDRVTSKKGWILLHEIENDSNNLKKLNNLTTKVNIKYNILNLNCKYISH